ARLRTVNVSLACLGVEKPAHEEHFLAELVQRREHPAEFHRLALALRPPLLRVKTIAGKQHRQPHWRLARELVPARFIAPDVERFEPWQGHGDADSAEKCTAGEAMRAHKCGVDRDDGITKSATRQGART